MQQTVKAFGFESISQALLPELSLDGIGIGRRTTSCFREGNCVLLLAAITHHQKFVMNDILANDGFHQFAKEFVGALCGHEFNQLAQSKKLQRRLFDFSPAQFENIDIFKEIEEEKKRVAPVLTSVIQQLAQAEIGRGYTPMAPVVSLPIPDICDGNKQEKMPKARRNRQLMSIVAI